jgi:hypothetical protein
VSSPGGSGLERVTVYVCTSHDCSSGSILTPTSASDSVGATSLSIDPDGTAFIAYGGTSAPGQGIRLIIVPPGSMPTR